jgi:Cysteine sulfinate desulfinase/cysteine desulfurase and related enzymes
MTMVASARTYLDYNATAPLIPAARAAMLSALDLPGNASSVHAEGRAARAVVARAREQVAALCGTSSAHVVFASSATEAACHILTPSFRMGRAPVRVSRLLVSAVEHPCMLAGGRFPAEAVTQVGVDRDGRIDLDALEAAIAAHDPASGQLMLALQHANNETGTVQPVAEAAAKVRAAGGIVVVDAVQAAGRLPVSLEALGADFLILSAHKLGGPKGAGALVASGEILMPEPFVRGGGQERGHRAGTENVAAIAGFGAAAEAARDALSVASAISARRDAMEARMRAIAPDVIVHGAGAPRLPNTSYFTLPGLKAETAQIGFDMEGIAVSSGSACSSGKVGASHVLKAMGADAALGAIRVSLGRQTTDADIEAFLKAFATLNSRRLSRLAGENAA